MKRAHRAYIIVHKTRPEWFLYSVKATNISNILRWTAHLSEALMFSTLVKLEIFAVNELGRRKVNTKILPPEL